MGCNTCPGAGTPSTQYDKRGNVSTKNAMEQQDEEMHKRALADNKEPVESKFLSYAEYKHKRAEFRKASKRVGDDTVKEFSEEYKRIQIDELISVFNHDEVHFRLTPTQALVALWELSHLPDYQKVINEFKGLRENVDKKYALLKQDNIPIIWEP